MTSLSEPEELLKMDARGRVLASRERREALLEEFGKSGMSGAQFARWAGINYKTFCAWQHRRRRAAGQPISKPRGVELADSGPVKLVEAVLGEAAGCNDSKGLGLGCGRPGSGGLAVDLPGGCRLWLESPAHLAMAAELVVLVAQAGRGRC